MAKLEALSVTNLKIKDGALTAYPAVSASGGSVDLVVDKKDSISPVQIFVRGTGSVTVTRASTGTVIGQASGSATNTIATYFVDSEGAVVETYQIAGLTGEAAAKVTYR